MKTIKEIEKKIKENKCNCKQTKAFTFKRKNFKKKLSTEVGFGYQDLKKKPKALIKEMACKGYDLSFIPTGDIERMEVNVMVNH